MKASIQRSKLYLTEKQLEDMDKMYKTAAKAGNRAPYCEDFVVDREDGLNGQQHARDLAAHAGLDFDNRESLGSRWSCRWSTRWNLGTGTKSERLRSLWQCVCGYDHRARQTAFEGSAQSMNIQNKRKKDWDRRVSYDFTGCLAHIEIIEDIILGHIISIAGVIEHNDECKKSLMKRIPYVPLHPHVYEVALQQLRLGASISVIHKTNDSYMTRQAYRDMSRYDPRTANIRYNFMRQDHVTLYRKFSKQNGIDLTHKPHENIDSWLNVNSPFYQTKIKDAIFHYSPRTKDNDRFELGVATEEMVDAAWKYGHGKQLLLDGTFGVCTSRILLFIAMGLNEDRKGVPLAFFIFSAKGGARATHASYDTEILNKMLLAWRTRLELVQNPFEPCVVITDNDTRERSALLNIWPNVILLLCKFHLRQSWTNYRKRLLGGVKRLERKSDYWLGHVHDRLRAVEISLINSTSHSEAKEILETEIWYLKHNLASYAGCNKAATAGIKHLEYLNREWMVVDLFGSWSQYSRARASSALGIPVEGVLTTTNHLESFNGLLKRTHLKNWKRSGRRLRVDTFIHFLILSICPETYRRLETEHRYVLWLRERFPLIQKLQTASSVENNTLETVVKCAYWLQDPLRDNESKQIIQFNRISVRINSPTYFTADCASKSADTSVPNYPHYSLVIESDGFSTCTCVDFDKRMIACKHLRAMRLVLDNWVRSHYIYPIRYPVSREEASLLAEKRKKTISAAASDFETENFTSPGTLDTIISIESEDQSITNNSSDDESEEEEEEEEAFGSDDNDVEYDWTRSNANMSQINRKAIQAQLENQFEHTAQQVLPKLHGLQRMMEEMVISPANNRSASFGELRKVIGKLHSLLGDDQQVVHNDGRQGWESAGKSTSRNPELRAFSPERPQMRFDSQRPY